MKTMHVGYWIAWALPMLLCVAYVESCDRAPAAAPSQAAAPAAGEDPLSFVSKPLVASPDGQGVYVTGIDGLYLVRGGEAVKVQVTSRFSPPASQATSR